MLHTGRNKEGGARHSRSFTSSKGCFVNLPVKPSGPISAIDVNDVDDDDNENDDDDDDDDDDDYASMTGA